MSHASRRRATGSPRLRSLRGTVRGSLALSLAALALAACAGSQAARPGPAAAPRAAATSPASPAGEPAPPAQDPATARSLIASGAVVLDVRTPDEFATGHVSSAVNVPVQELPRRLAEVDRLVGGDRSRPIVVYCGSGRRAGKAKSELEAAGYTQVVNGGGFDDVR